MSPADSDWANTANWTAGGPPNGSNDVATFAESSIYTVNVSADTEVNAILFENPFSSSPYTITVAPGIHFTISGDGVSNLTGNTETFVAESGSSLGGIFFQNSATAGSQTIYTANASTVAGGFGGTVTFNNTSSAGSGTFTAKGGTVSSVLSASIRFFNSATAGSGTFTAEGGSGNSASGSFISFFNSSNAGSGTFVNIPGTLGAAAGQTVFNDTSSASTGTFTNNGSAALNVNSGQTTFSSGSTAASALITNNGGTASQGRGGGTLFQGTSTAASATLIANAGTNGGFGGTISFAGTSTGGTARVEVFGNGNLDIRSHTGSVTVGSVEGTGGVVFDGQNLTVGSNDMSTTFSGAFFDIGSGASLTKIGAGTWTLGASNPLTGGTTLAAGNLIVTVDGGLGTGNVSLTGPTVILTLQNGATNNYIFDGATLIVLSGAKVNLNFTGNTDTVSGLVLGGAAQANGTYDASNTPAYFTGTGSVTVVPEPNSIALLVLGGIGLLSLIRRK